MRQVITPVLVVISLYLVLAVRIWSESFKIQQTSYAYGTSDNRRSTSGRDLEVGNKPTGATGTKCTNFEDRLDELVESSKSVFITMPAKAAGTSLKQFTFSCVGTYSYEDSKTKKKEKHQFRERR